MNNKRNIEEDIKILEEFKKNGYYMLLMKYGDRHKTNLKVEGALENLLTRCKQLEELNKVLTRAYDELWTYLEENYQRILDEYLMNLEKK